MSAKIIHFEKHHSGDKPSPLGDTFKFTEEQIERIGDAFGRLEAFIEFGLSTVTEMAPEIMEKNTTPDQYGEFITLHYVAQRSVLKWLFEDDTIPMEAKPGMFASSLESVGRAAAEAFEDNVWPYEQDNDELVEGELDEGALAVGRSPIPNWRLRSLIGERYLENIIRAHDANSGAEPSLSVLKREIDQARDWLGEWKADGTKPS